MIGLLKDNGAQHVIKDADGRTSAMWAIHHGNQAALNLLQKTPINPNLKSRLTEYEHNKPGNDSVMVGTMLLYAPSSIIYSMRLFTMRLLLTLNLQICLGLSTHLAQSLHGGHHVAAQPLQDISSVITLLFYLSLYGAIL